MNTKFKKTVSVAVASAIVFSMTGCSFLDKSKDEVLDAADGYAKELAACNIGKLAKISNEDFEDIQEEWEGKLTFSEGELYSADTATVLSAIADSISYEIDEESVEATKKSGEGSVDVTFSIADYESLLDDESLTDAEAFADAVKDADKNEISVTLEFERTDDGDWLGSNYSKVFEKLYAFTDEEFTFVTPVSEAVLSDELSWYGSYSDESGVITYTNVTYIDGDIQLDYSLVDTDVRDTLTYEVTCNGEVVYTGTGYEGYLYAENLSADHLSEDGYYIGAGTYTITFFDADGNELVSQSCEVILEETTTTTTTTTTTSNADYALYLTEPGDPFYDGTDCVGWYDGTYFMDDNVYPAGTTYIEFDLIRHDDTLGDVTYDYYYSVDGNDITTELGSFTASAASYNDGDFYECSYSGTLESGYYIVVVSYNGTQEVMGIAQVG